MAWVNIGVKIAGLVIGGIQAIEHLITGIKGKDKQDAVVQFTQDALAMIEGAAGKDVLDDAEVIEAERDFINAYVHLQNVIAAAKAKKG